MNAIDYLTQQHRELEALFDDFEHASHGAKKKRLELVSKISDLLAVHTTIEEKLFYPATKDARTEELLHEAVEEHLSVKRIVADLLELDAIDGQAEAKMSVMREQNQHHVEEEEKELFPEVRKLLAATELEDLGEEMERMASELMRKGWPRRRVRSETRHAAQI